MCIRLMPRCVLPRRGTGAVVTTGFINGMKNQVPRVLIRPVICRGRLAGLDCCLVYSDDVDA